MLQLLIIAAVTVVGGFSYKTVTLFERTKRVSSAPQGYPATWKEHVETIVSTSPNDRNFNAFVKRQAIELQRGYYRDDGTSPVAFAKYDVAGSLDVDATLIAASPEIISFTIGSGFYQAGMAHPNSDDDRAFTWSRKLNRVLIEQDVFARKPDRALRLLALARFDNRDNLQNPDDPDGIPLAWDRATIGRNGITWSYSPYELGGYLSGGGATLSWAELKPYLRTDLPFSIPSIRDAHG